MATRRANRGWEQAFLRECDDIEYSCVTCCFQCFIIYLWSSRGNTALLLYTISVCMNPVWKEAAGLTSALMLRLWSLASFHLNRFNFLLLIVWQGKMKPNSRNDPGEPSTSSVPVIFLSQLLPDETVYVTDRKQYEQPVVCGYMLPTLTIRFVAVWSLPA